MDDIPAVLDPTADMRLCEIASQWKPWDLPTEALIEAIQSLQAIPLPNVPEGVLMKARQAAIVQLGRERFGYQVPWQHLSNFLLSNWLVALASEDFFFISQGYGPASALPACHEDFGSLRQNRFDQLAPDVGSLWEFSLHLANGNISGY